MHDIVEEGITSKSLKIVSILILNANRALLCFALILIMIVVCYRSLSMQLPKTLTIQVLLYIII